MQALNADGQPMHKRACDAASQHILKSVCLLQFAHCIDTRLLHERAPLRNCVVAPAPL